jgi:hypothetical protein
MRRAAQAGLVGLLSAGALIPSARVFHATPRNTVAVTEVVAVYFGTTGTDSQTGVSKVLADMSAAVRRQTATSGRGFLLRGVSLEPSVEDAVRHLSSLAAFDEVSAGGNWTNSAVVRYLGGNEGRVSDAGIPTLVLLEREVRSEGDRFLQVGPEHEIARYRGLDKIVGWVNAGAPLPK